MKLMVVGILSTLLATFAAEAKQETWSSGVRYGVLSDFADNRSPRAYTHSVSGSVAYNFTKLWSLAADLGVRAETVGGQIPKGREQSYEETVSPSTSISVAYADSLWIRHRYSLFLQGEPLWDEASQQEGYKAVLGVGGSLTLNFFKKRFSVAQSLSVSELVNSYAYGSNDLANPDYFYNYKIGSSVKIYGGFLASYSFGAKVTRFMDDFIGYSYSNSVAIAHAWPQTTLALSYENGGFTDEGDLSLWYIDEYRRLARMSVGYTF